MEEKEEQFDPFDMMTFTYDKCFLCGNELDDGNRSDEHIYPKWLQNMYDLWDEKLYLLNGTEISYKDLKIPCCKSCNSRMSNVLERPISRAVVGGFNDFIKLDRDLIFQWLNKIAYGMLFKELSLNITRKSPEKGNIYTPEFLKDHQMQFKFLQSILSGAVFAGKPYSMLVFRIDPCGVAPYWAYDNPFIKTFFVRMNDIGIISHLLDNGYNEAYFLYHPEMEHLLHKTLHPFQFAEICAKFLCKCSLFHRNPFYTIIMDEIGYPKMIVSHEISGDAYDDWSQDKYADALALFWKAYGKTYDDIYNGEFITLTSLTREDGTFFDIVGDKSG